MEYDVLIQDGDEQTAGSIDESSIDYQPIKNFLGEIVRVQLHDENGNEIEKEGKLIEVL